MNQKKTYYSISEVSKLIGIHQHTIRFWDSKIDGISKKSEKGKTRFFTQFHINKINMINNLLKNNNSLDLALKIINKHKDFKSSSSTNYKSANNQGDSLIYQQKLGKIKKIIINLKKLIKQ